MVQSLVTCLIVTCLYLVTCLDLRACTLTSVPMPNHCLSLSDMDTLLTPTCKITIRSSQIVFQITIRKALHYVHGFYLYNRLTYMKMARKLNPGS